jgi:hypothetical protein
LRRPLDSAQYVSIKYTERLLEAGVEPSVGSVGDSYDNALAETINGLYKAEIIHRRGPWRRPLDSALATSNAARQSCCREKESNARLSLAKVIGRLESGDVLVVTRLDRLARSTRDLLNVIDAVSKRGAGFRSLKDAWADTTSAHGRLMLTVLGGIGRVRA